MRGPRRFKAERAEAEAAKRPYVASRRWAAESEADRARFEAEGRTSAVRLKMPREGVCRIDDLVRGTVESEWSAEADHVIQRADGTCLYHLASVVDDVEMGITHVIRAEEHLPNTPRQIFIFEGLGAPLPAFAHLPVVAEPGSRVKLSKRKLDKYLKNPEFAELYQHGRRIADRLGLEVSPETFNPVITDFYRIAGFLPEAILNYLLLLGWSLDDKTEMLSPAEQIAHFSLERVNKAAASFDPKKLISFQERYMQALPVEERLRLALPYVEQAGWVPAPASAADREKVRGIVAAASDRIKVSGDILDYDEFFVADEALAYDGKAFDKRIRSAAGAPQLLAELASVIAALPADARLRRRGSRDAPQRLRRRARPRPGRHRPRGACRRRRQTGRLRPVRYPRSARQRARARPAGADPPRARGDPESPGSELIPMGKHFIADIVEADLASGKHTTIQTRFPPEPNGYLHLGHAKSICLNFGLAAEHGGLTNLRFDDTNPTTEEDEYVRAIREDVRWLGFDWGEREFYASDYFAQLYAWAEQLVVAGKAFVDDSSAEEISAHRGVWTAPGQESPFRNRSVEENLDLFRRMRAGEFPDGTRVLRAKIDMTSGNINLRDPVMYRILHASHHRTGDEWCIYPMYDWAHGQSDSLEKITHSICTLEFEDHRPLYDWFVEALGIYPPRQIEFARLNVTHTVLSKRKLLRLVQEKVVSGWDDPRMPTLAGIRRRGIPPASLRDFCERIGVTKQESVVDYQLLEHCVREELNKSAERRMAVLDPVKVTLIDYPEGQVDELEAVNNPEDPAAGTRLVPFSRELWIDREDFLEDPPKKFFRLAPGREVRLRWAYIIRCEEVVKDAERQDRRAPLHARRGVPRRHGGGRPEDPGHDPLGLGAARGGCGGAHLRPPLLSG